MDKVKAIKNELFITEAKDLWDKIHGKPDLPIWKKESDKEYQPEFIKVVEDWITERDTGAFQNKSNNELNELLKERIRANPPKKGGK